MLEDAPRLAIVDIIAAVEGAEMVREVLPVLIALRAATVRACRWVGVKAPVLVALFMAARTSRTDWAVFVAATIAFVKDVRLPDERNDETLEEYAVVTIGLDTVDSGPGPILFRACIVKLLVTPFVRPLMVKEGVVSVVVKR